MLQTGNPFYGQNVGILVFSTITPRVSGDPGNNNSFSYPVRYEIVKGGFADLIKGGTQIKTDIINACLNLKKLGIKTIVGDCGLMSVFQNDIGSIVKLPIAMSSLCMIPLIWELIGREGSIGVITGHSELLSKNHLLNSGWRNEIPLIIQGMEEESHFVEIVINGGLDLDIDKMEIDVIAATEKLLSKSNNIRAILIECSNLGTFSKIIHEKTSLPIFDVISVSNLLESSINPKLY